MRRSTALHIDDELAFAVVDRDLALMRIEAHAEALAEDLAALGEDRVASLRAIARANLERSTLRVSMPRVTRGATTAEDVDRAVRMAMVHRGLPGDLLDTPDRPIAQPQIEAA